MIVPLEELPSVVQDRASAWAALGLRQRQRPVHPHHGKAVAGVEFESAAWLVEITIWISGEADLSTTCLTDDRVVNKTYELADLEDLNGLLDELVRLLAHDETPAGGLRLPVAGDGTPVVDQWPAGWA